MRRKAWIKCIALLLVTVFTLNDALPTRQAAILIQTEQSTEAAWQRYQDLIAEADPEAAEELASVQLWRRMEEAADREYDRAEQNYAAVDLDKLGVLYWSAVTQRPCRWELPAGGSVHKQV